MDHHKKIAKFLLEGNDKEALDYIHSVQTPINRIALFNELLTPTMYHIGDLWEHNEISVADEHLATAICDYILSKVDAELVENTVDKKVLLFGVEDEQHYLGLKMVASIFREKGWDVRYLGPNLPLDHARLQIQTYKPDVIGISAALSYRLPVLKEVIQSFKNFEWKPTVLIGGRMAKHYDLSSMASERVFVMKDLEALHSWLEGDQTNINATS